MKDWQTSDGIYEQHLQAVSDGVIKHGQNLSREQGGVANPIACTVLEDGILIGGVTGRTEFRRLFINYLWVDSAWRGRKLGTELLHRLEALALARGCGDALIETLDDGAADWYERCGYRVVAHLPGYCGPWSRHTLLKILNPESDV
jgi:GNAT superfamily N-acetyltransferase